MVPGLSICRLPFCPFSASSSTDVAMDVSSQQLSNSTAPAFILTSLGLLQRSRGERALLPQPCTRFDLCTPRHARTQDTNLDWTRRYQPIQSNFRSMTSSIPKLDLSKPRNQTNITPDSRQAFLTRGRTTYTISVYLISYPSNDPTLGHGSHCSSPAIGH